MATIKISSKVEASDWQDLQALARVRPDVLKHLEDSIDRNRELGRRLAE